MWFLSRHGWAESRLPDKNGGEKVKPELKKIVRHQTFTIFMRRRARVGRSEGQETRSLWWLSDPRLGGLFRGLFAKELSYPCFEAPESTEGTVGTYAL